MLKLQFKDQRKPAIWLVDSRYAIGRDKTSDIVIEDDGVNHFHAEIRVEASDKVFISDVGSASGTFVNGKQVTARTLLNAGDVIRISSIELELIDPKKQIASQIDESSETAIAPALNLGANAPKPAAGNPGWKLVARTGALVGKTYEVPATGRVVVGRAQTCDIVLPSNHVSRQHAELMFRDGQLYVFDLNSSNGTFVNRKRVTECRLQTNDELRLDTLIFKVEGPQGSVAESDSTIEVKKSPLAEAATSVAKPTPVPAPAKPTLTEPPKAAVAPVPASEKTAPNPAAAPQQPKVAKAGDARVWFVVAIVVIGGLAAWFVIN